MPKTYVVIFSRDTGYTEMMDSAPYHFFRGSTVSNGHVCVAFDVPECDTTAPVGKRPKIARLFAKRAISGFFRNYPIVPFPSIQ